MSKISMASSEISTQSLILSVIYPKQTLIPYPAISMLDRKWCSKTSPHLSLCKTYGKFDRKFSWTARRNLKSLFVCVGFLLQILCHKTLISYETVRPCLYWIFAFRVRSCIECRFLYVYGLQKVLALLRVGYGGKVGLSQKSWASVVLAL